MMKEYRLKYFDWALDRYAPLHRNSKIYTLSDSEHDFWTKMINKQNGYIRNQTSSEDAERQAQIAADNAEQENDLTFDQLAVRKVMRVDQLEAGKNM